MNFQYQLTADDFVDAQRTHLRKKFGRASKISMVLFGILLLGGVIGLIERPIEVLKEIAPFMAVLGAVAGLAVYVWSGIPYRSQFRKTKALQGPITMTVGADGISVSSERGEGKSLWKAFEGWRESKKSFLLYPQPRVFYVVPKRAMQSDQVEAFRELLKNRIYRTN